MRIDAVSAIERKSIKFLNDLSNRHGSVTELNGVYCAPEDECKEILRLPDFDKWREIFANEKEFMKKARKLYYLIAYADRFYREKNIKELAQTIWEISKYVKERLAGIRLYMDPSLNKSVLAVYPLSMSRGVYFVVNRPNHKVLLKEVTRAGLDRIMPSDIIDVWFMEWTW